MKTLTVLGLVLAIAIISSDAKLFKKKKWLPKLLGLGLVHHKKLVPSVPKIYEEHPKIVEIVKHVPVIQKVEVIKPIEIVKIVHVPVEVIKEIEVIKHVPVIQEVVKVVEIIKHIEVPVEVIREIEVIKEIPVVKTVEVPRPYEVIKHIPIVKTVTVEKPVIHKVPVAHISHVTKEISLPKLKLPHLPKIKSPLSLFGSGHETQETHGGYETYESY